jgi:dimethylamine/trimethylamine dehydrogenase
MIELLADLPDLWDITVDEYSHEMGTSRFIKEAALEESMRWVKQVTGKPLVSVGRLTSPDTMVRLIKNGVIDLVGAARPSIADPFLPRKIDQGREDEIRECIGCNICYTGDQQHVPIRCTQNPTIGEEWRRGWHPEQIPEKESDSHILIVGSGPAGLEAATALGQRGYRVTLAEAGLELGGRISREARLPGLAEWSRVRDWRLGQIERLSNVEYFLDSCLDAKQIREFAADRVALASGSEWRRNGVGRWHQEAIPGWQKENVFTPDELLDGAIPPGPITIFDDDHYYLAGVLAEKLVRDGLDVRLVTPAPEISAWTQHTSEQETIQAHLLQIGVELETATTLLAIEEGGVRLACVHSGRERERSAQSVVLVTSREPRDALFHELCNEMKIDRIGDCLAPGAIAHAVYAGHRYAREMDAPPQKGVPFRREPALAAEVD